ncbi:hypothetical protein [Devosia aquimaris]|uniref:hypothetical protein n=1 Tax=Devosia aquimaris TaxID=2866214 RepID=UPI001CD1160B|nr:hypothetical protein [Devosia sp. CJK-A8-3]
MLREHATSVVIAVLTVVIPAALFALGTFIFAVLQDQYSRTQISAYVVKLDNPEPHLLSDARATLSVAATQLDGLVAKLDGEAAVVLKILRDMLRDDEKLLSDVPPEIAHMRLVNNTDRTLKDVALMPSKEALSYLGSGATVVYDSEWKIVGQEQLDKLNIAPHSSLDFILLGDRSYRVPELAKVTLGGAEIDVVKVDLDTLSNRWDYFWEVSVISGLVYVLAALGAVLMVLIGISAPITAIPTWRRRLTSKVEFERMHGDVEALYGRYRPGERNPLEPTTT